jgi:hypothetical protein
MEFHDITEGVKVYPGEYILHKPSNQIVLCGAFKGSVGMIKALVNGRVMEDKVENFQKIKASKAEQRKKIRRCGGCKSR